VHDASFATVGLVYLACVSVALAFIDIDTHRLPDSLVLPSFAIVSALLIADSIATGEWASLTRSLIGGAILGGFYLVMWLAYPAGLGFGDVKTAGLMGVALGYFGWPALAVGGI